MAELRIAGGEVERAPVLEAEADAVALDALHRRRGAVDQAGAGIVPGPAHPITGAELHRDAPVDLDTALRGGETLGRPLDDPALIVREIDALPLPVDARDPALVAG